MRTAQPMLACVGRRVGANYGDVWEPGGNPASLIDLLSRLQRRVAWQLAVAEEWRHAAEAAQNPDSNPEVHADPADARGAGGCAAGAGAAGAEGAARGEGDVAMEAEVGAGGGAGDTLPGDSGELPAANLEDRCRYSLLA